LTITISDDRAHLDVAMIHRYLCDESYWARGIARERVERAIAHSHCFGAYDDDVQVGFARAITDYATFAYVADVFVLPSHRGHGVSKQLMAAIRAHRDLQDLRRWHLVTRHAHALYAQFGFTPLDVPERHMMIVRPAGSPASSAASPPAPASAAPDPAESRPPALPPSRA
jgi:GNAT superfamily N-acetyltransferase